MSKSKIFILACFLAFSISKVYASEKIDSLYKVLKIKTKGEYYVIHAQRNDYLFKIISKKALLDKKPNLELIRKGKYYYFDFEKKDDKATEFGVEPISGIINYLDVTKNNAFVDGKTKIKFTKRFHYRLYTTKNLFGLYYSPS